MTVKQPILVAPKTYWVGYVDDRKVPFHRLVLEKGTTYNSYLLNTKKPTLIDTVDISFGREFLETLCQVIDPADIEYIVINHVEPDHAGGLPALANKAKDAVIVTTELAAEELKQMFKLHHREFLIVRDGDTLDIGGKTLKFFETPFLHTEETMITYAVEDQVLFPCDQFSSHVATNELFNDLAQEDIMEDFSVYYKLIMHPHRPFVQDMIAKIKDLDIKMIAPSHGYILRDNVDKYITAYDKMSKPANTQKRAVIVYSSMTGNTKKIAQLLAEGLKDKAVQVTVVNLKTTSLEDAVKQIAKADAVLVGTSTRYADLIGDLEKLLQELCKLDISGYAAAFGSYGWSGEAIEVVQDYLRESKLTLVDKAYLVKTTGMDIAFPVRVRFAPESEEATEIRKAAQVFGELLIA